MARTALRARARLIAPVGCPTVLLLVLRVFPELDALYRSTTFDVLAGPAIAWLALVVAAAAAIAVGQSGEHGPVWLAFGCLCVGVLMLIHGLMTPGFVTPGFNLWIGRSPYLAITML